MFDDEDKAEKFMAFLTDSPASNIYANKVQGQIEVHFWPGTPDEGERRFMRDVEKAAELGGRITKG